MAVAKPIKIVKILNSPSKVEVEVLERKDINVPCRLCPKKFANEMAIKNHLRIEHSGEEVNVSEWVQTAISEYSTTRKMNKVLLSDEGKQLIAKKTADMLSSMKPAKVTSLASTNVSYILMKADDNYVPKIYPKKRKRMEKEPSNNSKKQAKDREKNIKKKDSAIKAKKAESKKKGINTLPLCGPFECHQPSTETEDGICHQMFFSCCKYSQHFREAHNRRGKSMKCQVCEKLLGDSTAEKATTPYPCQVCGAGFQTRNLLTVHVNTQHEKLKPFECRVCHKRFSQQGGVQQHMRLHTGDRPFPCTFCDKSFTQKSGLDQHLRSHTNERPYQCVVCTKSFKQSVHLKQHMRTHTNLTPFLCVICDRRFKQGSHLNHHLKTHNEANMTDDQKKKYRDIVARSLHVQIIEDVTSSATANLQQILDRGNDQQEETEQQEVVEMEEVEFDQEEDVEEGVFKQKRHKEEGEFDQEGDIEVREFKQERFIKDGEFEQEEDLEDEFEQEEDIEETEMEQGEEIDWIVNKHGLTIEGELEEGIHREGELEQEGHIEEIEVEQDNETYEIEVDQENEIYETEVEQGNVIDEIEVEDGNVIDEIEVEEGNVIDEIEVEQGNVMDENEVEQEDDTERVIVEQNDASNDTWSVLIIESNENSESN